MCMVEDERGNLIASCSTPPKDKMVIRTNTPRLQHHRKMILELLLAAHCRDCTICEKNQTCRLQELAGRLGLTDVRFPIREKHSPWMIPQFPSSGIPANASFAETASGYVMRYST